MKEIEFYKEVGFSFSEFMNISKYVNKKEGDNN